LVNKILIKENYKFLLIIFLLTIIGLEAFVFLKGFYSFSADDSERTLIAYNFLNGKLPTDFDWLPFHTFINALGLLIWNDLFWNPRIINLLFGIFSFFAVINLAKNLFEDKRIIILTAFLSAILPLRVLLTATALTEIMFIPFIVLAMSFFIQWLKYNTDKHLIFSSIFLAVSSSIRYEGWIFSAAFFVLILFLSFSRKYEIKNAKLFLILLFLSIVPIAWFIVHQIYFNNPLAFLGASGNLFEKIYGDSFLSKIKYNFFSQFIFQNLFFLIFLGIIGGIIYSKKEKSVKYFFILWAASFLMMGLLSILGAGNPSHAFWRIPVVWNYLLLPFMAYILVKFYDTKIFSKLIFFFLIILSLSIFYLMQLYFLTEQPGFSRSEKIIGDELNLLLIKDKSANVLIETTEWNYLHIKLSSHHPDNFILNTGKFPKSPDKAIISIDNKIDEIILSARNIRYFVVRDSLLKNYILSNTPSKTLKEAGEWSLLKYK
jgi:hypothetical protein